MNSIIAFIIVLGVLIVVHELGHFITAKLAGIAVPRFSIGLGPRVWGFTIGETEYVISALPLGGYVKMAGMGEDEALEALEGGKSELEVPPERRFESKSVATRSVVISAGVVMNFVFAIFAYAGIAYYQSWVPLIGSVVEGSPAEEAGLQAGDLVTSVDGQEVRMWVEFRNHVSQRPGEQVTLGVLRDDQEIELLSRIERAALFDSTSGDSVFYGQIGVYHDTINSGRALGLGGSVVAGTGRTFELTWLILRFVGRLITGAESARDIGGPILIGQLSGQAAQLHGLPQREPGGAEPAADSDTRWRAPRVPGRRGGTRARSVSANACPAEPGRILSHPGDNGLGNYQRRLAGGWELRDSGIRGFRELRNFIYISPPPRSPESNSVSCGERTAAAISLTSCPASGSSWVATRSGAV